MIPQTFDDWKNCIEKECKIELTSTYCQERITILQNSDAAETRNFEKLYGKTHLENVLSWFLIAFNQLQPA